jgi:DNA-binding response OmpR family regulator
MNILLIEDDVPVATMLNKGLSETGYSVTVAPDGNIGWELASGNGFDLLILDIMLPGINGLELCKRLRKEEINIPDIDAYSTRNHRKYCIRT